VPVSNAQIIGGITLSSINDFDPIAGNLDVTVTFENLAGKYNNASGYVGVFKNGLLIKTLKSWNSGLLPSSPISLSWDGKSSDTGVTTCGTSLDSCPDGIYYVKAYFEDLSSTPVIMDELLKTFNILNSPSQIVINSFTINHETAFDPSDLGNDETLEFNFTTNIVVASATIEIQDFDLTTMKTLNMNSNGNFEAWNGEYGSEYVKPGRYLAKLTVAKPGYTAVTQEKYFNVVYNDIDAPDLSSFNVDPSNFNPAYDDTIISFYNNNEAEITVTIVDGNSDTVKTFPDYTGDIYPDGDYHNIFWDGYKNGSYDLNKGTYYVEVVARNDYGVDYKKMSVYINASSTSSDYNSHIDNLRIIPGSFDPTKDDEISIRYDVRRDLDELSIFAIQGNKEIEILKDYNVNADVNYIEYWDAMDDNGDFVDSGAWRIEIRTTLDSTDLKISDTVYVDYTTPEIDELLLSKTTFDNDLGEFTYMLFKLKDDATVDIDVLINNRIDDSIEEELDVLGSVWYAVYFDGNNYDYNDDLDIQLKAYNQYSNSSYTSEKVALNLSKDSISSTRSNITKDYISPVVSDGSVALNIDFDLEDTADLAISIHKGTSSSGTKVIQLVDINDLDQGSHTIKWDGRDDNGNILKDGIYTYKIVSTKNAANETETGQFVIGDVDGSQGVIDSSNSNNNISSNVVVDNKYNINNSIGDLCVGFLDVNSNDKYCEAIKWAKSNGIVQGYTDQTFQAYKSISRAEFLKVVMEANFPIITEDNFGNLGFSDVESGLWYVKYIKAAQKIGVFEGDGGRDTARPNDVINRAEALKVTLESAEKANNVYIFPCTDSPYTDVEMGLWYSNYVCFSKNYGLLESISNYFNPGQNVSRGEMVDLLYKMSLNNLI